MKKIFILLMTFAALLACKKDGGKEDTGGTDATVIRLASPTILFEAVGAEAQTVKVFADGNWVSSVSDDWITIDPATGSGTVTVTLTVSDNESKDGRVGNVVFAPNAASTTTVTLTVQQKGDNKITLRTGAAFAEWLAGLTEESLDEARLAADIDMSEVEFTPAEGFSGTFDGGGFSIKNLIASKPLFKVNKGSISNVVIDESCTFTPDTCVFGALVLRNEGNINDCTNKATVTRTVADASSESNLIAGLIGMSVLEEHTISGCKNYGNVSFVLTSNDGFTTQGIAGVIALTAGNLENCENHGNISLSGGWHTSRGCPARLPSDPTNKETGEIYTNKVGSSLAGVASYVKGTATNCSNSGKITWTESCVENMDKSPARFSTAGTIGNYYGTVTGCTNSGDLEIYSVTSDGSNFAGTNHQHCIGGVLAQFNNPVADKNSKNRGGLVESCVNTGNIYNKSNTSKSRNWLGGVVGWPNGEDSKCESLLKSCSNSGTITIEGTSRFIAGGVAAWSGSMEDCHNTGDLTATGGHTASDLGGLMGRYLGYGQTVKNCSSSAKVSSTAYHNISCFMGRYPTKRPSDGVTEGNSVSGELSYVEHADTAPGMIVGYFDGPPEGEITIGTPSTPIQVSGKVNGVQLTSANAAPLMWFSANYDATKHKVYYVVN